MSPRIVPSARQRRLGTELRKMREAAGLSIQEAADLLGAHRSHITNIEVARNGVSERRLRTLAANYGCADTAYVEALAAMAREPRERPTGWWEKFRETLPASLLDLAELEHHAVRQRTFQGAHVPGLLQTEEYARAVFAQAMPPWSPLELELRVHHRMLRQAVLRASRYKSLVHEAALRTQFGGRKVLKAQLECLAEERENVSVLVIPFDAGGLPAAGQSIVYAEGPVPQLDTVLYDSPYGGVYLDAETRLGNYRRCLDQLERMALSEEKSRDFIRSAAEEL